MCWLSVGLALPSLAATSTVYKLCILCPRFWESLRTLMPPQDPVAIHIRAVKSAAHPQSKAATAGLKLWDRTLCPETTA